MAVSVLHTTNVVAGSTGTSKSYNHTCNSSTTLLIVRVSLRGTSTTPSSVSVTYGGTSMTAIPAGNISNTSNRIHLATFRLPYPTTGSALSVAASWTGTANCVIVATDVSGGVTVGGGAGLYGNSTSASLTMNGPVGSLLFDTVITNATRTLTPSGGNTAQYAELDTSTGSSDLSTRGSTASGAGDTAVYMTSTLDSAENWAITSFYVPAATTGNAGNFMLMF